MQQDPGLRAGIAAEDQVSAPGVTDDTATMPDDAETEGTVVSRAPASNMPDGRITEGVPVCDVHGETIGNVAAYDEAAGALVVRAGWFFAEDTTFPISAITDRGASGIYLNLSKEELKQQYGEGGKAQGDSGMQGRTAPGIS
ncbi:MAG TPA: hypothetical protein VFE42_33960 [Chloroflexota bacterium]|nr:hypothetical protein [Chloroflexota bacterium]